MGDVSSGSGSALATLPLDIDRLYALSFILPSCGIAIMGPRFAIRLGGALRGNSTRREPWGLVTLTPTASRNPFNTTEEDF